LYRVLFLLFAEARGLVPLWHPVYRDRYSLEAIVTVLLAGRPYRGLWRAVHAISRLAHAGCSAGDLRVTAFNGRLFNPSHAAAFDGTRLSDLVMSRTVVALSSTPVGRQGVRSKILYRDLDVEQLGAVYERVLEYEPALQGPEPLERTRDLRKASGSFYTPRAVTTHLVHQTIEPLIRGRTSDQILTLRVLDPAMGSGAFLVAACRYLASAVEDALVQEGRWHSHDVTPADRVALRREIASRCLFGVDLNPMAVQLARLSLWLATLASDKPLSFLDHHLVAGHSLVGATPEDLSRQPGGGTSRKRQERLSLFEESELSSALALGSAWHAQAKGPKLLCAPYVPIKWPLQEIDPYDSGAIVGNNVPVRGAPSHASETLGAVKGIDPETGRITKSLLTAEDPQVTATLTTTYRHDERFQIDVPVEMNEDYVYGSLRVTGTATYGRFRQFQVQVDEKFLIKK